MNIFILDLDISRCARSHCDLHVSKMILESVQMLCTALNKRGYDTPYRPTHARHPCVLWVEESYGNFQWLAQLAVELNREFRYRYDRSKDHASIDVLRRIENLPYENTGLTEFAQAMPDQYKVPGDAVADYRGFYLGEKSSFATWKNRGAPNWWLPDAA
ncbi:MAG: hypothetical protein V2I48_02105 [Xanthomonadales bacterium]|nr:hypothetical protein [Xanthomonadales bacterium]